MKKRLNPPNNLGSFTDRSDENCRQPFIIKKFVNALKRSFFMQRPMQKRFPIWWNITSIPPASFPLVKFSDIFELWKAEKYPLISLNTQNGYNAAFKILLLCIRRNLLHLTGSAHFLLSTFRVLLVY